MHIDSCEWTLLPSGTWWLDLFYLDHHGHTRHAVLCDKPPA